MDAIKFILFEMVTYRVSVVSKTKMASLRIQNGMAFQQIRNTYFMFNNFFFPKIDRFRDVNKIWYSQTGHRGQHNTAPKCYVIQGDQKVSVYLMITIQSSGAHRF
jgi:hypothetical protein